MALQVIQIKSSPGIKRDGTKFEGDFYVDGQWCRWQRGLPRKIGGYRQINNFVGGVVRQFHTQALNNFIYTHMGYSTGLQRITIDTLGNTSAPIDRTPDDYVGGPNFTWQFDAMYDSANATAVAIIASAASSAIDISNSIAEKVYIGKYYDPDKLTEIDGITASGGVCVLHPYLFVYGSSGYVQWSDANDPENFATGDAGDAYIDSSKVVKILPLRGGGQAPAGIIWTLDRLIRVSYVGDPGIFAFDTITASSSVLATNSIIEYDGIYFWIGMDRFLMYNGVVQEVENNMNINYFFDGLNTEYANRIFAYKVPRYGEIWWCYPRGDATECTHAIIYNFREKTWYDTELPNSGRSAGLYAQVFHSPIMAGVNELQAIATEVSIVDGGIDYVVGDVLTVSDGLYTIPTQLSVTAVDEAGAITGVDISNLGSYSEIPSNPVSVTGGSGSDATFDMTYINCYKIWRHEVGVDEIDGTTLNAIRSYFETADISALVSSQPRSVALRCEMIEPDFVQVGDMSVNITGRINARAPEIPGPIRVFPAVPQESYQQQVFFKEQRREMRFRFESNTVNGNYQMGQVLGHVDTGDGRYQS